LSGLNLRSGATREGATNATLTVELVVWRDTKVVQLFKLDILNARRVLIIAWPLLQPDALWLVLESVFKRILEFYHRALVLPLRDIKDPPCVHRLVPAPLTLEPIPQLLQSLTWRPETLQLDGLDGALMVALKAADPEHVSVLQVL